MNERAAGHEYDLHGTDVRLLPEIDDNREGCIENGRESGEEPDEGGSSAGAFGEKIPAGVNESRGQHQPESKCGHDTSPKIKKDSEETNYPSQPIPSGLLSLKVHAAPGFV
jgi:hypothetical protein